jgi:hypothetical protein
VDQVVSARRGICKIFNSFRRLGGHIDNQDDDRRVATTPVTMLYYRVGLT